MSDDNELYSLYGNIGNKRVQPIRAICQNRLTGMDDFVIRVNLKESAEDARIIARKIDMLGGSKAAVEKANNIADVLEWWVEEEKEAELRQLVEKVYEREYIETERDTSTSDFRRENSCPYEDNPDKRSCWGCHVPIKVYEVMERRYQQNSWDEAMKP